MSYKIYEPADYKLSEILEADLVTPKGNRGGRRNDKIIDLVTAFDIETTAITEIEQSVMYLWAWAFDTSSVVIGRTWNDFLIFVKRLKNILNYRDANLIVWVHNLSYEFQFLRGIYSFGQEEVFCLDRRKILKCTMYQNLIEFRCSYLHSNMSLAEYTNKLDVEHKKLSGDIFDYSKRRYWYTDLTKYEIEYQAHDVLGVVECIKKEMSVDGDNLYSIPMTSTGYVRRDIKSAIGCIAPFFNKIKPTFDIFVLCREAFRGGNCHASRLYSNIKLENMHSYDRSSSYPEVQINYPFPMSVFTPLYRECDEGKINFYMNVRGKALIFRARFKNIRLRKITWGFPYIAKHKCRETLNIAYDNGRVLSADYMETTLTDIDFKIIQKEYIWDEFEAFDCYVARYKEMPKQIKDVILEYYEKKTKLKDIPGEEIYYMKSKNKLNSIYGNSAQNPAKHSIFFIEDDFVEDEQTDEEILCKTMRKVSMPYTFGVWTTAYARYELERGLDIAGWTAVYCDTDSVKCLRELDFTNYNNEKIELAKKNGGMSTDKNGVTHYLGVYEREKDMVEFKTMGAKKYAYRTVDGKLHVTISGVNKKKGAEELEEHGGIDAMEEGFVFRKAGGTESVYNDFPDIDIYENEDGEKIRITSNVYIRDSTYTLGLTEEYRQLLERHYYLI